MSKSQQNLVILIALPTSPVVGQAGICKGLQSMHTEYGDDLYQYLSDHGHSCLAENQAQPTSTTVVTDEVIWSESGDRNMKVSVSLEFSQGVYDLNLVKPTEIGKWGAIFLDEIISVPDGCFQWSRASFPSQVRINETCRVYATLDADWFNRSRASWEASISRKTDALPTTIHAQDWYASGRGLAYLPMELFFAPGIYRLNIVSPSTGGDWGFIRLEDIAQIPRGCFPDTLTTKLFPNQIRISRNCRIYSTLNAYLVNDAMSTQWEISVIKLD